MVLGHKATARRLLKHCFAIQLIGIQSAPTSSSFKKLTGVMFFWKHCINNDNKTFSEAWRYGLGDYEIYISI